MTVSDPPAALADRYAEPDGPVLLTGVQALVRLPIDQHRRDAKNGLHTATLVTGYPGSPLGGYDLELARRSALLAEHDVIHVPAVNEELAATAVWGSQLVGGLPDPRFDGVVGLWYGKAPGLDRAADAIRHANLAGVTRTGGALALVGDDAAAKSSTVPSSSEPMLASLLVPTLCPGTAQEVLELGLHGIALSRCAGVWVGLKIATNVADGFGTVMPRSDSPDPVMVEAQLDGRRHVHEPTMHMIGEQLLALEHSLAYARLDAARAYAKANGLNRLVRSGDGDRLGIVALGKSYYDLRQALRDLGLGDPQLERLGIRLLHIRMPFPLERDIVRDFGRGLEEILVVEEKQPFLERLVKEVMFNVVDHPTVLGKHDEEDRPLLSLDGELDAGTIARVVGERVLCLGDVPSVREHLARLRSQAPGALPFARPPFFCSGCPHNTSVTKLPDGAVVGGGIGCHGMVTLMRESEVGMVTGLTQMGGEGAQWIGQAPFTGTPHIFQNLGDGTFHHSGSLAIRASVAAAMNITYKLLWNSHIAMTGGQSPVPSMSLGEVTHWLAAEGVKRIIITTEDVGRLADAQLAPGVEVWDRSRIVEAQHVLAAVCGTTVLIHDQECAAELRRRRKRGTLEERPTRVYINERVCEGCGDCGAKSNCLSVHPVDTEFGRKTQIHQASCNTDYTCLDGDCPSFIVITPGEQKSGKTHLPAPLDGGQLPEPDYAVDVDGFALRITGIGGTGVVTVAQTLATAAMLDGRYVAGLDQTGLAQKGGAVVSDLRLGAAPSEQANKLDAGDCDLYLVADLLVGASAKHLIAADPGRTVAVVSTARVPTGLMVVDTTVTYPNPDELMERILARSQRERHIELDAPELARRLVGTELVANMLLVGAAYQAGRLPISAASIERAIQRGAAVAANLQAFRRGRQSVCDPPGLSRALGGSTAASEPRVPSTRELKLAARVAAPSGSELHKLVVTRVAELVAYQDERYAARYVADVERVRAAEAGRVPGHTTFAEAVAVSLHKLMAYKDEYEVARLHLDPAVRRDLGARFGADAKVAWKLHPPMLRALGLDRKLTFGPWFAPAFRCLVAMRRLRGTRLDPFGATEIRRTERRLIVDYRALITDVVAKLSPANHPTAVEIASLPELICGYETIKLASVERYYARLAALLPRLDGRA